MSIFILGSTGLVGSNLLQAANQNPEVNAIATVGRRLPKLKDTKIKSVEEKDTSLWPEIITKEAQEFTTFVSAFGTTRAAAGTAKQFRHIDHGVTFEAAKAAKNAGVQTFILVSTSGANSNSWFLYMNSKGRLEDDIIKLQFPRTVILRPGVLLGEREKSKGLVNKAMVALAGLVRGTELAIAGEAVARIALEEALVPPAEIPLVKYIEARALVDLATNRNSD